ncbi:MAG: TonB-dependent receptor, partial [Sphingobacteriia bacterium]
TGANYRLITNVGASTSKGIETYIEFNPIRAFSNSEHKDLILFSSYSYNDARYSVDNKDANTKGKKVENAPQDILRAGISYGYKGFLCTMQWSYVGSSFSDANNTIASSVNGNNGIIPSYTITDLTASYKFSKKLNFKAGVNNVWDERYFTRRAGGYPGPGALPADGRTFFLSVGAKL